MGDNSDQSVVMEHTTIVTENGDTAGQTRLPNDREPKYDEVVALCASILVNSVHMSDANQTEFIKDVVNQYNIRKDFQKIDRIHPED